MLTSMALHSVSSSHLITELALLNNVSVLRPNSILLSVRVILFQRKIPRESLENLTENLCVSEMAPDSIQLI